MRKIVDIQVSESTKLYYATLHSNYSGGAIISMLFHYQTKKISIVCIIYIDYFNFLIWFILILL